MYYILSSGSWVVWLVFIVVLLMMNGKINRLSDRLDTLAKGGTAKPPSPAPATPPSLSQVAASFGTVPSASPATIAAGSASVPVPPKPAQKIDGEEASGRWLGKIGVLAIVLGVSFFLKWAFDNNLIGPMGRIVLGFMGGGAMVGVGQFLRRKYLVYSDIVTGGGIAILYLTIFAAYAFYGFIGMPVALLLMFAVTALSVTLSVVGGTVHLAVLGVLGGLLTPLLIRGVGENYGALFSYLALLDLGVLGVALFKKWNGLNILGFVGTAIFFTSWTTAHYHPDLLGPIFAFLTFFFLIYLVAGIVHNVLYKKDSTGIELALITLNAAGYGLMSYALLSDKYSSVLGFFMLILALFYFAVSYVAYRMNQGDKALNVYLPGIGVVFLTVAMPLQFSGAWITLAWLLEAAVLVAAGSLTRRHSMNIFAVIVYAVGLVRYFSFDARVGDALTHTPVFNSQVFLALVAVAVAYLLGYMFVRHMGEEDADGRRQGAVVFFVLANILTLYILTSEINVSYAKTLERQRSGFSVMSKVYYDYGVERSERQQAEFRAREQSYYDTERSTRNRRNTVISIVWALYAAVLTAIGFGTKRRVVRILGLILFFVTAFKVLIDVWQLGQLYRIISSISFGVIALLVSFAYAKWKDRLKEVL
jgi:uncharacterized membrane protein